ncbi:MAG TPA: adenylosuccinate synthase [Chitinophagales bacterium]|nr:adenylosuccinate synthase [Chitinophagales bacterium]
MAVDVLLGLQWGDEGKGKIVDFLAPNYDVVARFQGGPNAGHTLNIEGKRIVLRTIPSGVFCERPCNLIGNGVVIDPIEFLKEAKELEAIGIDLRKKLKISQKAHLIVPTHRLLDAASEAAKGQEKIGSTLKGIGPAYMDKTGRNGLRVGDLQSPGLKVLYEQLKKKHLDLLSLYNYVSDFKELEQKWFEGVDYIRSLDIVSGEYFINEKLRNGKLVLAEGAQGSMLDIDFGTYPFVTSSNTISAAACTGLGIPPTAIRDVMGIIKAYCTRVGGGPFPTELTDETGEELRKAGHEFGAVTGRPRRCGWLDLVAVNYTIMVNGVTKLIITKADVLNIFDEVKVCNTYSVGGTEHAAVPFDITSAPIVPVYETLPGWKTDHSMKTSADLPDSLHSFMGYVKQKTGVDVSIISIGAGRDQLVAF